MKTFIALGSNIEPKLKFLHSAIDEIDASIGKVLKISSFYETKPLKHPDDHDKVFDFYINCALISETNLMPNELLNKLLKIENKLGRKRSKNLTQYWQPRTIDLDIIFYEDLVLKDSNLEVPHPRVHTRDFVLVPIMELDENKVHPILKKTVKMLYLELLESEQEKFIMHSECNGTKS